MNDVVGRIEQLHGVNLSALQDWSLPEFRSSTTPDPQVGDRWHIKYPSATACVTVDVEEVSISTVVIHETNQSSYWAKRYVTKEITWVELVKRKA